MGSHAHTTQCNDYQLCHSLAARAFAMQGRWDTDAQIKAVALRPLPELCLGQLRRPVHGQAYSWHAQDTKQVLQLKPCANSRRMKHCISM